MMPQRSSSSSYKAAVGVRGDCLYCPLSLSIDSYFNCLTDCHHCYSRRLNRTWGMDLRPADPEDVERKLTNGLKNKAPKSTLACALSAKKTLRLGNRTDPYQEAELEHRVSRRVQEILIKLEWTYVIQTKFLSNLRYDEDVMTEGKDLLHIMPVISPGAEGDWELFERKRTTPIPRRLRLIKRWISRGFKVGVNGEPFIPGYHTPEDFQSIIKRLKEVGVTSYNTYNLHFNDHVAKRLHSIGVDIERVWHHNQDAQWRPILRKLLDIAREEGMELGCPDFVNTGWGWKEPANTCCGIDVPNPSLFNSHHFKQRLQSLQNPQEIIEDTWEGIGDKETGTKIVLGEPCDMYTMGDAR